MHPPIAGNGIDEASDWTAANDPCTILFGTYWRIPTQTEWTNVDNSGFGNLNDAYESVLKLHAAGRLCGRSLSDAGSGGCYWSIMQNSNTHGWSMWFYKKGSSKGNDGKSEGFSIRCLRD